MEMERRKKMNVRHSLAKSGTKLMQVTALAYWKKSCLPPKRLDTNQQERVWHHLCHTWTPRISFPSKTVITNFIQLTKSEIEARSHWASLNPRLTTLPSYLTSSPSWTGVCLLFSLLYYFSPSPSLSTYYNKTITNPSGLRATLSFADFSIFGNFLLRHWWPIEWDEELDLRKGLTRKCSGPFGRP